MKKTLFLTFIAFNLIAKGQNNVQNVSSADAHVKDLVSRMTLEEKISYINGTNWMYTKAISRLGIPAFKMTDGPVGVKSHGKSTAYPASVLAAASWDPKLMYNYGVALGRDCRARGVNFLLGPGVNIARAPMTGRNFEYLGEDPFLASELVVNYINGVQNEGVIATVKHFAANNQEYDRDHISSDIDERTLHEIYLPAFKAAVKKGKVGSVMNSYNLLNGVYTSHHNYLNNEILKGKWGFDGILMSDWGGIHDDLAAFKGGTDLDMPGNSKMANTLMPAFASGEIKEETINDKVSRILRTAYKFGFFDRDQTIASIPKDDPKSAEVALELARGGIVLLKNEDKILPLNGDVVKKVAFIGPNADSYNAGGGSSQTEPFHWVTALQGFKTLTKNMEVSYTMGIPTLNNLSEKSVFFTAAGAATVGLKAEYFDNQTLSGNPKAVKIDRTVDFSWVQTPNVEGIGQDNFSVRWTGVIRPTATAAYKIAVQGDDGYRLWINDKPVINYWSNHGFIEKNILMDLEAGKEYSVRLEYYEGGGDAAISFAWYLPKDQNFNDAIQAASSANVVVLCLGFNQQIEHEGAERPFELPKLQDSLIKVVTKANPNTIVVLNAGGNVYMEKWLPNVKGLLHAFYPGQEGGTALAEILLGSVNPSGKLPVSFEKKWADNATFNNYYDTDGDKRVQYKEGLLVGYRHYDKNKIEPMFPFGFGLSYTTFTYANLSVDLKQQKDQIVTNVSFDVKNTGNADGAEIAQLYVSDLISPVLRPVKELKGFSKILLKKGAQKRVTIALDASAFSYYKAAVKDFGYDAGEFNIQIGQSAKDIKLSKVISLN